MDDWAEAESMASRDASRPRAVPGTSASPPRTTKVSRRRQTGTGGGRTSVADETHKACTPVRRIQGARGVVEEFPLDENDIQARLWDVQRSLIDRQEVMAALMTKLAERLDEAPVGLRTPELFDGTRAVSWIKHVELYTDALVSERCVL